MASRILKSNYPGIVYKSNLNAYPVDLRYDPTNGNVELVQQGPGGQVLLRNGKNTLVFTDYGQSVLQFFEPNLPPSTQIMPAEPFVDLIINDVRAAAATVGGKLPPGIQRGGTQPAPGTPAPGTPPRQTPGSADPGPGSGIGTTFDVGNYADNQLKNLLSEFDDPNNFDGIKQFLYYPSNIGASGQDKITITQISYVPGDPSKALTGSLGSRESDFNSPTVKTHGMVILPIPNELSETNQTGWGEDSLSTISAALMGAALPTVRSIASGEVGATLGNLNEAAKKITGTTISNRLKQFLTVNAASSVLKLGNINVNPEAYITRVTGTAINPNLELLFNGPKLRQFGFQFKLTPRDEKEARNIRSIIKFFKKGMAPRRSNREALSIFLGTPNVFRIKFTSGETGRELNSVGKLKTCALQSFSASYTPDGFYAAYKDAAAGGSQPISVVINLAFIELTPIFNDEYDGNSPSVGPEFVQEQAKAFVSVPQPGSPNFIGPVPGGQ